MEKLDDEYSRLIEEATRLERKRTALQREDSALAKQINELKEAAAKALCPYREGDLVFCHSYRKGTYEVTSVYLRYDRIWALRARRYDPGSTTNRAEVDLWESHGLSLMRAAQSAAA
jgi:hypothetical protein